MDGVELSFEDDALGLIVDKTIERKLGARGLRSIVESIMMDVMFEIPSSNEKKFVVTKDFVEKQLSKTIWQVHDVWEF